MDVAYSASHAREIGGFAQAASRYILRLFGTTKAVPFPVFAPSVSSEDG
jgi:hypothetical protein